MKKLLVFILVSLVGAGFFLCLSSCERKLKNQPDLGADRLFIVSMITPQDTLLVVKVFNMLAAGKEYTYNGTMDNYFDPNKINQEATVVMSDGTNSIALSYDLETGTYTANPSGLSIQEGTLCSLVVSAPGKRTATAACRIPKKAQNFSIELDSVTPDEFTQAKYIVRAQWQDSPEEGNYYLAATVEDYYFYQKWFFPYDWDSSYNYVHTSDNYGPVNKNIVSDKGKNNIVLKHTSGRFSFGGNTYYSVWYSLYSIDRNYAKYDEWLRNLYADPFVQPSLVHTNVSNGLGVFSGAYKNTVLLKRNAPF